MINRGTGRVSAAIFTVALDGWSPNLSFIQGDTMRGRMAHMSSWQLYGPPRPLSLPFVQRRIDPRPFTRALRRVPFSLLARHCIARRPLANANWCYWLEVTRPRCVVHCPMEWRWWRARTRLIDLASMVERMEATFGMEGVLVLIRCFLERGSFVFSKFGVVSLLCWGRGRD